MCPPCLWRSSRGRVVQCWPRAFSFLLLLLRSALALFAGGEGMGKAPPPLSPVRAPMASAAEPRGTSLPLQQPLHSSGRTQSAPTHGCQFRAFSRLGKVPDAPGCFTFTPSPKQPSRMVAVPLCLSPALGSCSGLPLACWAPLSLCHTPIAQLPGGSLPAQPCTDSPIPTAHSPISQCSGQPLSHIHMSCEGHRAAQDSPAQDSPTQDAEAETRRDSTCPPGRAAEVAPAWPGRVKLP